MLKLLEAAIIVLIILDFYITSTFSGRLQALDDCRLEANGSACVTGSWKERIYNVC